MKKMYSGVERDGTFYLINLIMWPEYNISPGQGFWRSDLMQQAPCTAPWPDAAPVQESQWWAHSRLKSRPNGWTLTLWLDLSQAPEIQMWHPRLSVALVLGEPTPSSAPPRGFPGSPALLWASFFSLHRSQSLWLSCISAAADSASVRSCSFVSASIRQQALSVPPRGGFPEAPGPAFLAELPQCRS